MVAETVAPVAECVFAVAAAVAVVAAAAAAAAAAVLGVVSDGAAADSAARDQPVEGSCPWRSVCLAAPSFGRRLASDAASPWPLGPPLGDASAPRSSGGTAASPHPHHRPLSARHKTKNK